MDDEEMKRNLFKFYFKKKTQIYVVWDILIDFIYKGLIVQTYLTLISHTVFESEI